MSRKLGAGGMGVVYEAFDCVWQQTVALKTLIRADESAIYRLKAEFRSLADVSHPNLVSLYDLFVEDDLCFFTMELVDGVDFISYVQAGRGPSAETTTLSYGRRADTNLAVSQSVEVKSGNRGNPSKLMAEIPRLRAALRQLAEGLCALHEADKLHRDIKPSNIMVTAQGRVVILDFGLTTELEKPNLTQTLKFAGTPAYMSPEQGLDQLLTPASDWYGVGVTLYQSLTGSLPFSDCDFVHLMLNKQKLDAVPPSVLAEGIPDDLESLCCALLSRHPQARPSGREVLQRLGDGSPAEMVPFSPSLSEARRLQFVGRERDLERMSDAFAATKSGQTLLLYIHARSGMGKTSLVRHFLEGLQRREKEVIVLEGRCYERESVPYKALDGIMDSLSRCLRSMPEHQAAALMPRDVHALSRLFPVMLRVNAVANAPHRFDQKTDPLNLRSRAGSALRELLARISDHRPLVLFVDDLHWADADSMILIEDLLRPPGEPSLLLLVSFRSEEAQSVTFLKTFLERIDKRQGRELTVGPLADAEASQLVDALLDGSRIGAQQLVPDIVREGDGSPFFLEQLARWTLANKNAVGTASISLDQMLKGRIAPLPVAARTLLETLAVAAAPLDVEVACLAAGIESGTRPLISALRVANLIRSTGVTHQLEIYHDRIREHLASNISLEASARMHLNIATALESKGLSDPEALFEHYFRGGMRERAAGFAVLAARKSVDALAFDRAAMFYRNALDLASQSSLERIALKNGLAKALANAGRPAEAAKVYLDAAREAVNPQALDFQRRAAEQLLMGGHLDQGRDVIQNVLRPFGLYLAKGSKRALVSFLLRRLQLWLRGLKFDQRDASEIPSDQLLQIDICWAVAVGLSMIDSIRSADFQTRHLLLALRAGEPYRLARAMAMEAGFSALSGGPGAKRASQFLAQAQELSKKVENPHAVALTTLLAGVCSFLVGDWRKAARLCEDARGIFREKCRVIWEQTSADSFLLGSLLYLGEYATISDSFGAMLASAQERGNLYASTELRTRMNSVWLARDDPERARRELGEAIQSWSHEGFHRQHYNWLLAQANIELYTGKGQAAYALVNAKWPELRGALLLRIQVLRLEAFFLKARTILASTQADHELLVAEGLAERIARERMRWADPLALLIRSGAANLRGQPDIACSLLREAMGGFESAEMKGFAAVARRQLGSLSGAGEGSRLMNDADLWMTEHGIRDPARFTNMLAPGFRIAASEQREPHA